jgi:hypothetical protein
MPSFLVHNSTVRLKMRSNPTKHVFSIIDLVKWVSRTNDAAGLTVLSPNSAQDHA